ncbi:MAG: hypothetical protein ACRC2V_04090 [Xenococcaceae cyanobacterium]
MTDFSNTAWVYQGTWQPVDNILFPPIYVNASFLLIKIDALYCSKKPAILAQYFETSIGKVYATSPIAIYFNKIYLIEFKPILDSKLEIFCLNGSDVSIWVGTDAN